MLITLWKCWLWFIYYTNTGIILGIVLCFIYNTTHTYMTFWKLVLFFPSGLCCLSFNMFVEHRFEVCSNCITMTWITHSYASSCTSSFQHPFKVFICFVKWKYYINISIQSCCIIYMIFNTVSPYDSGVRYMFCIYLSVCIWDPLVMGV